MSKAASSMLVLASLRKLLLGCTPHYADIVRAATDAGITLTRLSVQGASSENLLFEILQDCHRGGELRRLHDLVEGIIPRDADKDRDAAMLLLRELGWRPQVSPTLLRVAIERGDWYTARALAPADDIVVGLEALIDPWHALKTAIAPPDSGGLPRWWEELQDALKRVERLRGSRDLLASFGCDIAARRIEVMELRLCVALIHRTYNPLMGTAVYQSVLRHLRDNHPTTASRLAWLWGATLLIESQGLGNTASRGALTLKSPAARERWPERPSQLAPLNAIIGEVRLAAEVVSETRSPDRQLARWLQLLSADLRTVTRRATPARFELVVLDAAELVAPDDIDISLIQCLVNAQAARNLRKRIEASPMRPTPTPQAVTSLVPAEHAHDGREDASITVRGAGR